VLVEIRARELGNIVNVDGFIWVSQFRNIVKVVSFIRVSQYRHIN